MTQSYSLRMIFLCSFFVFSTHYCLAENNLTNYTMHESNFSWYDAKANGYNLSLSGDDVSGSVNFPFNFTYYNDTFDMVYVSSNGWLSFDNANPWNWLNVPFPDNNYPYAVAPFFEDLRAESNIYVWNTTEFLVIEYNNYSHQDSGVAGTFEVIFFSNGSILFQYYSINTDFGATVGLNFGLDEAYVTAYTKGLSGVKNFSLMFEIYEHNLFVTLEVPSYLKAGLNYSINLTITNSGCNNESNVILQLYINNALVVNQTYANLSIGASESITYMWTPFLVGTCNITAYAPFVENESLLIDNMVTELISVMILTNYDMNEVGFSWYDAKTNGYDLGLFGTYQYASVELPFEFGYYDRKFDTVYVSSNAWLSFNETNPWDTYIPSLPADDYPYAIFLFITYLKAENNIYVWNTSQFVVIQYEKIKRGFNDDMVGTFEVVLFSNGSILFQYASIDSYVSGRVGLNYGLDLKHYTAYTQSLYGVTDFSLFFEPIEHNLEVGLEAPSVALNNSTHIINCSVTNTGFYNETNVDLRLYVNNVLVANQVYSNLPVGKKETISYIWTPKIEQVYNITSYAVPLNNEPLITDNNITKLVPVTDISNYNIFKCNFSWYDAKSNGHNLGISGDDEYGSVNFPFDFTFYDKTFDTVYVSSNGWLSFDDTTPWDYSNPPFPSDTHPYAVAPFFNDLEANNNIYAWSTSEFVVIQYDDYDHLFAGKAGTFQVVFFASGHILFQYKSIEDDDSATVGLNHGIWLSFYTSYNEGLDNAENFALLFTTPKIGPILNNPSNVIYEVGDTRYNIEWIAIGPNASNYTIYKDGTDINNGTWISGIPMNVNLSGLSIGSYNYTIIIKDTYENSIVDTVIVTVEPLAPPELDNPPDINYTKGSKDNKITWVATDISPSTYTLYINGTFNNSGAWSSENIIIDIDGLASGVYNFTLVVQDIFGLTKADTVIVTVFNKSTSQPPNEKDDDNLIYIILILLTLALILAVGLGAMVKKTKKKRPIYPTDTFNIVIDQNSYYTPQNRYKEI